MKPEPSSKQLSLARKHLVRRVNRATVILLTNVPAAMSGLSDQGMMGYALITFGAAVLCVANGAAIWVVRIRLTP